MHATTDGEWHLALISELVDQREIGSATFVGRGNVEEAKLVDVAQVVHLHRLHRASDGARAIELRAFYKREALRQDRGDHSELEHAVSPPVRVRQSCATAGDPSPGSS